MQSSHMIYLTLSTHMIYHILCDVCKALESTHMIYHTLYLCVKPCRAHTCFISHWAHTWFTTYCVVCVKPWRAHTWCTLVLTLYLCVKPCRAHTWFISHGAHTWFTTYCVVCVKPWRAHTWFTIHCIYVLSHAELTLSTHMIYHILCRVCQALESTHMMYLTLYMCVKPCRAHTWFISHGAHMIYHILCRVFQALESTHMIYHTLYLCVKPCRAHTWFISHGAHTWFTTYCVVCGKPWRAHTWFTIHCIRVLNNAEFTLDLSHTEHTHGLPHTVPCVSSPGEHTHDVPYTVSVC